MFTKSCQVHGQIVSLRVSPSDSHPVANERGEKEVGKCLFSLLFEPIFPRLYFKYPIELFPHVGPSSSSYSQRFSFSLLPPYFLPPPNFVGPFLPILFLPHHEHLACITGGSAPQPEDQTNLKSLKTSCDLSSHCLLLNHLEKQKRNISNCYTFHSLGHCVLSFLKRRPNFRLHTYKLQRFE